MSGGRHWGVDASEGASRSHEERSLAASAAAAPLLRHVREPGDLGILEKPGKVLAGTRQVLRPGGTLRFITRENQIWGLGEVRVDPPGALEVRRSPLGRCDPTLAGGSSFVEYAFRAPSGAPAGSLVRVSAEGRVQTRSNPNWAFEFTVEIASD